MKLKWQAEGWLSGVRRVLSPNQEARPAGAVVSLLVIHSISLPPGEYAGDWVERFFVNRLDREAHPYFAAIADVRVSSHFFVRRSGRVVQFVGCDHRAWHAGRSQWAGRDNCNDFSVGIELEGLDNSPFTEDQYAALWQLIDMLRARYPLQAIAGHSHIAPERKTDPGTGFDWAAVRRHFPSLDYPAEVLAASANEVA